MKTVQMITTVNLVPYRSQLVVLSSGQETFTFVVTAVNENYLLPSAQVMVRLLKKHFTKDYTELHRGKSTICFKVGKLSHVDRNLLLALITSYTKFS